MKKIFVVFVVFFMLMAPSAFANGIDCASKPNRTWAKVCFEDSLTQYRQMQLQVVGFDGEGDHFYFQIAKPDEDGEVYGRLVRQCADGWYVWNSFNLKNDPRFKECDGRYESISFDQFLTGFTESTAQKIRGLRLLADPNHSKD
ncbi:MAG: hypothetical protein AAB388_03965 [Patescibacteria group bacterium]